MRIVSKKIARNGLDIFESSKAQKIKLGIYHRIHRRYIRIFLTDSSHHRRVDSSYTRLSARTDDIDMHGLGLDAAEYM